MAEGSYVPNALVGVALSSNAGVPGVARVERPASPNAFSMMNDQVWKSAVDRDAVIESVYKYDCKIDNVERWFIKESQEMGRKRLRAKNIVKKEGGVVVRTMQIRKKKEKIRATKKRIEAEARRLKAPPAESMELSSSLSCLKPLAEANIHLSYMKSIFTHLSYQQSLPGEIRKQTIKIPPSHEAGGSAIRYVRTARAARGQIAENFTGMRANAQIPGSLRAGFTTPTKRPSSSPAASKRNIMSSALNSPTRILKTTKTNVPLYSTYTGEPVTPRTLHVQQRGALYIQSLFRGRRAREWVDNQAQRLFPLRQNVSKSFRKGGTRDRAIFLQKKSEQLQQARERLKLAEAQWVEMRGQMIERAREVFENDEESMERFRRKLKLLLNPDVEMVEEWEEGLEHCEKRIRLIEEKQALGQVEFDRIHSKKNRRKAKSPDQRRRSTELEKSLSAGIREMDELKGAVARTGNKLSLGKIQKRLDAEAIMLHKNMRFIAACVIQEFVKGRIHHKFPHLDKILEDKNKRDRAEVQVAFKRNESRKGCILRKELNKRKNVGNFAVIPIIIRMQRDWREYLSVTHSKRQIADAYSLLKRMREDRISGREFFEKLKKSHLEEIGLAVDFNLGVRMKYIQRSFAGWFEYTQDRLKRKSWLWHRVRVRAANLVNLWFVLVATTKRELINAIKPNLFPPLLAEYVRFSKTNDWQEFLGALSVLFGEFDEESHVRSLEFEEHLTNKVIGFNYFTELNEMLTYHIARSRLRKKVVVRVGIDESLPTTFWWFLNSCSVYLWTKANETEKRNAALTQQEEVGLVQNMLHKFLMKRNLNPPSFSSKFRMRSKLFLRWHSKQELCNNCLAILPLLSNLCEFCRSVQMPRYMRDTQATTHSDMLSDGVMGNSLGRVYVEELRGKGGEKNDVKGVYDVDEQVDLFVYHACVCVLAPFGSWRRSQLSVGECWLAGVRGGSGIVHGMKRRGVLTVGDLYRVFKDDRDVFDELFIMGGEEQKVWKKSRELLHLLEDVLHDALGESTVGGDGGDRGDDESVAGSRASSWKRLTNLGINKKVVGVSREYGRGLEGGRFKKTLPLGDSFSNPSRPGTVG